MLTFEIEYGSNLRELFSFTTIEIKSLGHLLNEYCARLPNEKKDPYGK